MHFHGNATLWLQSAEERILLANWETFVDLVIDRFGKSLYQVLYRQFIWTKQTSIVQDYIKKNQVSHEPSSGLQSYLRSYSAHYSFCGWSKT